MAFSIILAVAFSAMLGVKYGRVEGVQEGAVPLTFCRWSWTLVSWVRKSFCVLPLCADVAIVESDSPRALLKKKGGLLRSLVDDSADKEELTVIAHGERSSPRC